MKYSIISLFSVTCKKKLITSPKGNSNRDDNNTLANKTSVLNDTYAN